MPSSMPDSGTSVSLCRTFFNSPDFDPFTHRQCLGLLLLLCKARQIVIRLRGLFPNSGVIVQSVVGLICVKRDGGQGRFSLTAAVGNRTANSH